MKRPTIRQLPLFMHVLLTVLFLLSLIFMILPLVRQFRAAPTASPTNSAPLDQEFDALLRELEASRDTIRTLVQ